LVSFFKSNERLRVINEVLQSFIDEELTNEGCLSNGIMIMGTASPACY